MVIINSQTAQLANRLWGFSTFIANSIEHDYRLVNPGFFPYRLFFEATRSNCFDGYPITVKRTGIPYLDYFYGNLFKNWSSFNYRRFKKVPALYKYYYLRFTNDLNHQVFDLNQEEFLYHAKNRKVLVCGWMFRDPVNVRKHADKIRKFFTPVEPYRSEVARALEQARKLADVLVGVHIRRGDYASFLNGIWFYSDREYASMMRQLTELYASEGKTCAFFVCSNEMIDESHYTGLKIAYTQRHFIVDLYGLSGCDAIIGPPSTFSQWAAYYGDKPLSMILCNNQKMTVPVYNPAFLPDQDFVAKEAYRF
jgi:hypothetical protein